MAVDHLKNYASQKDKTRVTVRLPLSMSEQLRELGDRDGLTTSDVIRKIINDKLRKSRFRRVSSK